MAQLHDNLLTATNNNIIITTYISKTINDTGEDGKRYNIMQLNFHTRIPPQYRDTIVTGELTEPQVLTKFNAPACIIFNITKAHRHEQSTYLANAMKAGTCLTTIHDLSQFY